MKSINFYKKVVLILISMNCLPFYSLAYSSLKDTIPPELSRLDKEYENDMQRVDRMKGIIKNSGVVPIYRTRNKREEELNNQLRKAKQRIKNLQGRLESMTKKLDAAYADLDKVSRALENAIIEKENIAKNLRAAESQVGILYERIINLEKELASERAERIHGAEKYNKLEGEHEEAKSEILGLKRDLAFANAHLELIKDNAFEIKSINFDPNYDDRGYIDISIRSSELGKLLRFEKNDTTQVKIGLHSGSITRWDDQFTKFSIPLKLKATGLNYEPSVRILSSAIELEYGSSIRLYFEDGSPPKKKLLKKARHYSFEIGVWLVRSGEYAPILINMFSTFGYMPKKSKGTEIQPGGISDALFNDYITKISTQHVKRH